jgi:transcriptional regulator with XRE-family HTH domain
MPQIKSSNGTGRFTVRGVPVVTFPQLMLELGVSRHRLGVMRVRCDYVDQSEGLKFRWETSPYTMRPVQVIDAAKIEDLKVATKEVPQGRITRGGQFYLSSKRALRELRVPGALRIRHSYLVKWATGPCVRLGGKQLGGKRFRFNPGGGANWWFLERDILRLKESLVKEARAKLEAPKAFPDVLRRLRQNAGFSQCDLATKLGVSRGTIQNWECGSGQPRPPADLALSTVLGISPKQLRIMEWDRRRPLSPQHSFDGVFYDDQGRVSGYSIRRSSIESGISKDRLQRFVKRLPEAFCSIFPEEGLLPSELRLVPGTANFRQTAIRPEDLKILQSGIADTLYGGPRPPNLRTADEICDKYGVDGFDRFWARKLLRTLARINTIKAKQLPRKQIRGLRGWSSPWVYDINEVSHCLAGRKFADVLEAFALHRDWDYSLPAGRVPLIPDPAAASTNQHPHGLSETEEAIIQATQQQITETRESASAQQIANRLHYKNNSYFRERLAKLVKAGHLRRDKAGYVSNFLPMSGGNT